jgi:TPP-dependent pyruvate/acetoin dehydrogenase alpha subunit
VVFFCQNNQWAISVPRHRQTAAETLAQKAIGYGFPGIQVDGNDVFAVYRAAKEAIENARAGFGVTLLEVKTFRLKGHAEHDNQSYVPQEIIDEWRSKDPIERFETTLVDGGIATQNDFDSIQQRVRGEVDAATDEAERSPMPRGHEAARGLFAGDGYWNG